MASRGTLPALPAPTTFDAGSGTHTTSMLSSTCWVKPSYRQRLLWTPPADTLAYTRLTRARFHGLGKKTPTALIQPRLSCPHCSLPFMACLCSISAIIHGMEGRGYAHTLPSPHYTETLARFLPDDVIELPGIAGLRGHVRGTLTLAYPRLPPNCGFSTSISTTNVRFDGCRGCSLYSSVTRVGRFWFVRRFSVTDSSGHGLYPLNYAHSLEHSFTPLLTVPLPRCNTNVVTSTSPVRLLPHHRTFFACSADAAPSATLCMMPACALYLRYQAVVTPLPPVLVAFYLLISAIYGAASSTSAAHLGFVVSPQRRRRTPLAGNRRGNDWRVNGRARCASEHLADT